jgi:hypothetical protein
MTEKFNIKWEWNSQQEIILKKWGEISSCYQWMYDKSYRVYRQKNINFALPVIILSTITGTANFAQETFPEKWKEYIVMFIGSLNLLAGLLTTIAQFLRVNELQEGFRVAEIGFSKLSRDIEVTLDLPIKNRNMHGSVFLESCKQEYDRLLEQSPAVPNKIVKLFHNRFSNIKNVNKPNILNITEIEIFEDPTKQEKEISEDEKEYSNTLRSLHSLHEELLSFNDIAHISNETENTQSDLDSVNK